MSGFDWAKQMQSEAAKGRPVCVATVVRTSGSVPREAGAKMLILADGEFFGSVGGGNFEDQVIQAGVRAIAEQKCSLAKYPLGAKTEQCCGGVVEIFFEVYNHGPRLFVFGAGHVGRAVADVMEGTPFRLTFIDSRKNWLESLPESVEAIEVAESNLDAFIHAQECSAQNTYAVIMTHDHGLDRKILTALFHKPLRYLGLIGSKGKWARFQQRFKADGVSEELLTRVKCPIGMNTGGKSPKEVAISLAAELLSIHYRTALQTNYRPGTLNAPPKFKPVAVQESVTLSTSIRPE